MISAIYKVICGRLVVCILVVTMLGSYEKVLGHEMSHIAYFPFSAETLVPITTKSIWQAKCRKNLEYDQAKELISLLSRYSSAPGVEFDQSRVRLGVELDGQAHYVDANIVVYAEGTKESKIGTAEINNVLKKFVEEELFGDCREVKE